MAGALAVDHVRGVHEAALVRVLVHRRRRRRHEGVRAIGSRRQLELRGTLEVAALVDHGEHRAVRFIDIAGSCLGIRAQRAALAVHLHAVGCRAQHVLVVVVVVGVLHRDGQVALTILRGWIRRRSRRRRRGRRGSRRRRRVAARRRGRQRRRRQRRRCRRRGRRRRRWVRHVGRRRERWWRGEGRHRGRRRRVASGRRRGQGRRRRGGRRVRRQRRLRGPRRQRNRRVRLNKGSGGVGAVATARGRRAVRARRRYGWR